MGAPEERIVREYFELNGFFTRQLQPQSPSTRSGRGEGFDRIAVYNPRWVPGAPLPRKLLFTSELEKIGRAVVAIQLWQQLPRQALGTARASAEVLKFLSGEVLRRADDLFPDLEESSDSGCLKILVVPVLPTHDPSRSEAIKLLDAHGIDCLLSFRTLLQDVISHLDSLQPYRSSSLLRILRMLKNYDMLKSPQLELFGDDQ